MVNDYDFLGVRGLGGKSTSTGVDVIAEGLRELGIKGDVINQEFATTAGVALRQNSDRKHIIFGYSMGAADAIDIAKALIAAGNEVPLLFTMDPAARRSQVDGVDLHINVWQEHPMFGLKPFFEVAHVASAEGTLRNVKAKDVSSHGDLDDTSWVQELFIEEVAALIGVKKELAPSSMVQPSLQPTTQTSDQSHEDSALEALHEVFFDSVRRPLFNGRLNQSQVDGMKGTLAAWLENESLTDLRWLAYMFATTWLETDRTMQPIKEYGGRDYFMRMYDITGNRPHIARQLGNTEIGDGARYCGRGKPMITGRGNYRRGDERVGDALGVSFEANPELVLQGDYSDRLMFSGMIEGWYTGKKLADYFNNRRDDPVEARRIVNGTDRQHDIAKAHEHFLKALRDGFDAYKAAPSVGPIIPDEIIVTGQFNNDLSRMTEHALIELIGAAALQLSHHQGHQITLPSLSQNPSGLQRRRGTAQTEEPDNSGVNPMKNIDGLKTYIVAFAMALIALSEGVLGVDIPGAEMQSNWIEYVLGAAGLGTGRHAIAKLIKAVIG